MTITYSEAGALMRRSRSGRRRLGNNTYLYPRGDSYAVRYHSTDIVTIYPDGTFMLSTGGWDTITTKQRINDYGPARVYSENGVWAVWHKEDPRTPPKIDRCRACKGTGAKHTKAWTETYGPLPHAVYEVKDEWRWRTAEDGLTYPDIYARAGLEPLMCDGRPVTGQPDHIRVAGQVVRHETGEHWKLPEPVFHPSEPYACPRCDGTGQRDYGSKPMPYIFADGIKVDGTGKVIRVRGLHRDRLNDPRVAERKAREQQRAEREYERQQKAAERTARAELARNRTERVTWLTELGLTVTDTEAILFKAVREDLRSAHGALYVPETTVTAEDYAPVLSCGGGLHFSPTPRDALSYDRHATRFLACAVELGTLLTLDDKVKARSCRVLYEVDENGEPLNREPAADDDPGPDPVVFG